MFFFLLLALTSWCLAAPTSPPFLVQLVASGKESLIVTATVTNTGSLPLSVLETDILYPSPLDIIQVVDPKGRVLEFEGLHALFDIAHPKWTIIEPGKSLTNALNLDSSFTFTTSGTYTIRASSSIHTREYGLVPYQASAELDIPETLVAHQSATFLAITKYEVVDKRGIPSINATCPPERREVMTRGLQGAVQLATQGSYRVSWDEPSYRSIFKDKSPSTIGYVRSKLEQIGRNADFIRVNCEAKCEGNAIAVSSGDVIYPCDSFWSYPAEGTCGNEAWAQADLLLHEIAHSFAIGDVVYGLEGTLGLPTDQALNNADSFRYFSRSAASNCGW